ncbi:MAG: DUF1559 domain-containing protein [Thermoguttaceae bacterium]
MSTHIGSGKCAPRGFTLVELLVVISIIGTLVALLVPAVQAVRERGRQTVCVNNQHEVSTAIIHYESVYSHFPGAANSLSSGTVNWAVLLLPYLGREDLWLGTAGTAATPNGWCTGCGTLMTGSSGTATCVRQLMCPDDTGWGTGANCAPLTYVVNGNVFLKRVGSPYNGSNDMTIAQIKSPQQTIMLGEKNSGSSPISTTSMWWSAPPPTTLPTAAPWNVTFIWSAPAKGTPASNSFFGANGPWNHPALVIVSFFDGHTASLPDTVDVSATGANYLPGP